MQKHVMSTIRAMRPKNTRRCIVAGMMTLGLAFVSVFVAPTASAGATGYDAWASFKHPVTLDARGVSTEVEVVVPGGTLMGQIKGKGLKWSEAGGFFTILGRDCIANWHMSVVFYKGSKSDDNKIVHDQVNQSDCNREGGFKIGPDSGSATLDGPGHVCIRLYEDFGKNRLASVCHRITER